MTTFDSKTGADEVVKALSQHIKGKTVIVTGVTMGSIGAETARVIASQGGNVVLAARNAKKIEETITWIKSTVPDAKLRSLILDLSSFEAVRKAAGEVNGYDDNINVLINNAAIMAVPYAKTADGIESQFATNHLAHFLFTALIFKKIAAAGTPADPSRVVNVSSWGHNFSGIRADYNFSDGKEYNPWKAYGQSKSGNVIFAKELNQRAKAGGLPVVAYSLHPGAIHTNLSNHLDESFANVMDELKQVPGFKAPEDGSLWTYKSISQGTSTSIVAAFDPSILGQSGSYLSDCHIANEQLNPQTGANSDGGKLWSLSEELINAKFAVTA